STLILQGPNAALWSLVSTGDLGGTIISAGVIKNITSTAGNITADISTTPEAMDGDIRKVSAAKAFSGSLYCSGDLWALYTYGDVGLDPDTQPDYVPTVINVIGDVKKLYIRRRGGLAAANLYSDLEVGGTVEYALIRGGLFGNITVNGNVKKLVFEGDMGAFFTLGSPGTVIRGNLEVRGYLGSLILRPGSDLIGNVTSGGDTPRISVTDGDIFGDVTSLYGNVPYINVLRGSLFGNVSANLSVGSVKVYGTAAVPEAIVGTITAVNGGVDLVYAKNASVNGAVSGMGGAVKSVNIINGSLTAPVTAVTSVDKISVVNGSATSAITAGTTVGLFSLKNGIFSGILNAGTGIQTISMASAMENAIVRSGGFIGKLSVPWIFNTLISTATSIGSIAARDGIEGSQILVGNDVGPDGILGTADDNILNGGVPHSGSVKTVSVGPAFTNSTLALGVAPGPDGIFGTADDIGAAGSSSLTKLTGKKLTSYAGSLVVAETSTGRTPAGLATATIDNGGPAFDPANAFGTGYTRTRQFPMGGTTVTARLTGPGVASLNPATGQLIINGSATNTTITLSVPRNTVLAIPITVVSNDDAALRTLSLSRGITLSDANIDGPVGTIKTYALGTTLNLPGGVTNFYNYGADPLVGFALTGGHIGKFINYGAITSGNVAIDSAGLFEVRGDMDANFTTTLGGVDTYRIRGGDQNGDFTSRGTVKLFDVINVNPGGAIHGAVMVTHGDLTAIKADDDVTNNVTVMRGGIKLFDVQNGDVSNTGNAQDLNAIRALTGIKKYNQAGGDFRAALTTQGVLSNFFVVARRGVGGTLNGRILGLAGIGYLRATDMVFACVSSGADFNKAIVTRDMYDSYLFAGFDPGDDGFDLPDNNRDDNWIDAFTENAAVSVPQDMVRGGNFKYLLVGGDMIRSSVSAAVGVGADGFLGSDDDVVSGAGFIYTIIVRGRVEGSLGYESYGFSAANVVRRVVVGRQPFGSEGNVVNEEKIDPVGPPKVADVVINDQSVEIRFTQPLDTSTLRTSWYNFMLGASTIELIVSENTTFGDGDDVNITETVYHSVQYDDDYHTVTVSLVGESWVTRDEGTNFLLTLDGDVISDASGQLLDGEYDNWFPSGDNEPGGDFVQRLHYGDQGDTTVTALDLTKADDKPIIIHNQPIALQGTIGDNPDLVRQFDSRDKDVFRIDANQGDILYVDIDDPFLYYTYISADGAYTLSPTGTGYLAEDETVTFWVEVGPEFDITGSYELYIHLFNDGNSDLNFVDTQVIGGAGGDDIASLAANSVGDLYAVDNTTGNLIAIDPTTGNSTIIGNTGMWVAAADFDAADTLWAVGDPAPVADTANEFWMVGVANDDTPVMHELYDALTGQPNWSQTTVNARLRSETFGRMILSDIDWLAANAQSGDTVVVYYNGDLDIQTLVDANNDEPLAPTPPLQPITPPDIDDSIGDPWNYPNDYVTDDELAAHLSAIDPNVNLVVIIDAVDADTMLDGLSDLTILPNAYIMASSSATDTLWWMWTDFTDYLVEGIGFGLPADVDFNGTVTVDEWFVYAEQEILNDPWWTFAPQTPVSFDTSGGVVGSFDIVDTTVLPPVGMDLVTINTGTGAVTPVQADLAVRNIPALAIDGGGTAYAINGDTNRLLTINTGTGAVTDLGPIYIEGDTAFDPDEIITDPFTSLEFIGGQLHAATDHMIYEIDTFGFPGPEATPIARGLGLSDISALGYDPTTPGGVWAIDSPVGPDGLTWIEFGFSNSRSSQMPTEIFFDANGIAKPDQIDADSFPVQILTAPDDVDVYALGELAEGTPIDVTLLTRTIGSDLIGAIAIFNSRGETIASTGTQELSGSLDSYLDAPLVQAYAPATDTYTVAVWGTDPTSVYPYAPYVYPFGEGLGYDLTVEIGAPILPVPVPPVQNVYLNFLGGNAPYLADADYFGPGTDTYQGPFEASDFGFNVQTDTQTMINQIVAKTEAMYAAYSRINFTTQRPFTGDYAEVIIGGDVGSFIGLLGVADSIDSLNGDQSDMCVVFGGEFADIWSPASGYTMDEITTALGNTVAHELGHILGLEHQQQLDDPTYLLMAYGQNTQPQEFGRGALVHFLIGYQNDDVLLRVIA
ncbi:hypothetical protein HQ560_12845, partial [bacterium]|nr:hypothetical protein [bacterium]